MSDKVIRLTTVDGKCVTHHAMRADDGGEQCIRCHTFVDVLHVGFLCGRCKDADLKEGKEIRRLLDRTADCALHNT